MIVDFSIVAVHQLHLRLGCEAERRQVVLEGLVSCLDEHRLGFEVGRLLDVVVVVFWSGIARTGMWQSALSALRLLASWICSWFRSFG